MSCPPSRSSSVTASVRHGQSPPSVLHRDNRQPGAQQGSLRRPCGVAISYACTRCSTPRGRQTDGSPTRSQGHVLRSVSHSVARAVDRSLRSAAALAKGGTASVGVTRRSAAARTLCTVRQGCSRWRRGCRLLCRIVLRNGSAPGCAAAGTGGVSPRAAHDACAPRAVRWRTAGLATLTGSNRSWPPRCAAGRHRAPCVIGLMARREGPAGALLSVMKHGYYTGPDAASRPQ